MKTRILALVAAMAFSFTFATSLMAKGIKGNGKITTKTIHLSNFDEVNLGNISTFSFSKLFSVRGNYTNSPKLIYKQSSEASLKLRTDENVIPYINVKVQNGVLSISTDKDVDVYPTEIKIYASSTSLSKVNVSGGSEFEIEGKFDSPSLSVNVSGGGDFEAEDRISVKDADFSISGGGDLDIKNLSCGSVTANVSGGGDADIKGEAKYAEFKVSGGGDLDADELIAEDVTAKVSGGGDIKVYASKRLNASASGGGDIYYKGNPEVESSTSGGGDVHKVK